MEKLKMKISGAVDLAIAFGITGFIVDLFPIIGTIAVLYYTSLAVYKLNA